MLSAAAAKQTSQYALLTSYLSATTSITDLDTIRNLTKGTSQTYRAGGTDEEVEGCLWRLWGAILVLATETPADGQGPLVDVLRGIQQRPSLTGGDLRDCRVWGLRVWRDLPVFGAAVRESFETVPHDTAQFVSLSAFLARLTTVFQALPKLDFSLYALWTFRKALEAPAAPSSTQIQAAQQWMLYAGETLQALSAANHSFEGKVAKAGPAVAEKEWTGFSAERWGLWMERLEKESGGAMGEKELLERAGDVVAAPTVKAA